MTTQTVPPQTSPRSLPARVAVNRIAPSPSSAGAEPTYDERRWKSLPVILTATFMALFDLFVVNVAAPSIQGDLHASSSTLELVIAGYSFTYAAGLVTGGRLGDLLGRRRLFVLGMTVFTLASLLAGVAPNSATLVAGRLLQGVGAAAMVPQVLSLITVGFPPAERPRVFALFGATVGIASVLGQVLGGVLLDLDIAGLGWRPIFLVNVPIGIAAVAGSYRFVRESKADAADRLDPRGLVLLTGGLGAVLAPLVLGRTEGWPLWTWISFGAGAVLVAAFARWQLVLQARGGHPLVPPRVFRHRGLPAGLLVNLGFFVFLGSFLLTLTVYLQEGLGDSPLRAGLTLAPLGVAFAVSSLLGRGLVARFGPNVLTAGALTSLSGLVGSTLVVHAEGQAATSLELSPVLMLIGVGNGLVIPSLIGAVLQSVPPAEAGAASGVLTTTQQFSAALGIAGIGTLFFTRVASHGIVDAAQVSFVAQIGVVVLAAGATLLLPRRAAAAPAPVAIDIAEAA
ncbi:MAG TPA: MFS transporter [Mycobacteriales bacterium]|nr:MFS transporter [Mycobacteriales bacterium]